MTRKFVKGEIVKILDYREKRFIGKFGEILLIAEVEPHMLPFMEYKKIYYLIKIFHKEKKKISFGRLLFRRPLINWDGYWVIFYIKRGKKICEYKEVLHKDEFIEATEKETKEFNKMQIEYVEQQEAKMVAEKI